MPARESSVPHRQTRVTLPVQRATLPTCPRRRGEEGAAAGGAVQAAEGVQQAGRVAGEEAPEAHRGPAGGDARPAAPRPLTPTDPSLLPLFLLPSLTSGGKPTLAPAFGPGPVRIVRSDYCCARPSQTFCVDPFPTLPDSLECSEHTTCILMAWVSDGCQHYVFLLIFLC